MQVSYPWLVSVHESSKLLSTLSFNRFFLRVFHMEVYLNSQKVSTSHAQLDQPLLEKSVFLVIDRQCWWICLLERELKLVQSLGHTWEPFLVIVHPQTWKQHCRFAFLDLPHLTFLYRSILFEVDTLKDCNIPIFIFCCDCWIGLK